MEASAETFSVWLKRAAVTRIRATLLVTRGNQKKAAAILGMSRITLWRYLRWDEQRAAGQRGEPL